MAKRPTGANGGTKLTAWARGTLNMAGDLSGGIAALRRSAEINPNAAAIRLNLARSLQQHGQLDEAERVLRRMAEDFPSQDLLVAAPGILQQIVEVGQRLHMAGEILSHPA